MAVSGPADVPQFYQYWNQSQASQTRLLLSFKACGLYFGVYVRNGGISRSVLFCRYETLKAIR